MNRFHQAHERWLAVRQDMRARHAERTERESLARELAVFDSRSDLSDLAAILDRYDDVRTDELRDLVNWTLAA